MSPSPSGWYPNPHNAAEELYWDGASWLGASRVRIIVEAAESHPPSTYDAGAQHTIAYERGPALGIVEPGSYDPTWDTMPLAPPTGPTSWAGFRSAAYPQPYEHPYAAEFAHAYPPHYAPSYPSYSTQTPAFSGHASAYPPWPTASPTNGFAVAALILGACGVVLTAIPLMIGLVVRGIPDLLAVVFGVVGIVHSRAMRGAGLALSITGAALGALGMCAIPFGAGWLW